MMLPFVMASLLVSAPDQAILDDASALGRDLIMGQACDALEVATLDDEAFDARIEDLRTRAQAASLSIEVLDNAVGEAYAAAMVELEARYPAGKEDAAKSELTATCQELITTRPDIYSAFRGD